MLKIILSLGMEILHRPSNLRCAIWHNLKESLIGAASAGSMGYWGALRNQR